MPERRQMRRTPRHRKIKNRGCRAPRTDKRSTFPWDAERPDNNA